MSHKKLIVGAAAILLVGGWYAFRPERLFIDKTVNESFDVPTVAAAKATGPVAVLAGDFQSGTHETRGRATIYTAPDGTRTLRLTDFHTSNGPDVRVYLVAAEDATDNAIVTRAGFVDLGAMKGNVGDQNYAVPADVDLDRYRAVTIWCRRFSMNFGTAALQEEAVAPAAETMEQAMAAMPAVQVTEPMPAATNPVSILAGSFRSVAHETNGTATVYRLNDGRRVLRLTEFATSNGPDVRIYLVAAHDATDSESVTRAGFVELGKLKGNRGDQNYDIPAELDLERYRAVTVWCKRFAVNFGTAPLAAEVAQFTVRIENVSTEKTLALSNGTTAPAPTSPGVWALYRAENPIFATGKPAGTQGLEPQAEEGNPEMLAASLTKANGVVSSGAFTVPVGDTAAGPLLPGKTFEFQFTAQPGDRLTLAFMFGQSNDLFYAPADAGIALFDASRPITMDITPQLALWDAGTEQNQEPGLGPDQAPRQKSPNTGDPENGIVRLVNDQFKYPATAEVVRVTITGRSTASAAR